MELTSFSEDMRKRGLAPAGILLQWNANPNPVPKELQRSGFGRELGRAGLEACLESKHIRIGVG